MKFKCWCLIFLFAASSRATDTNQRAIIEGFVTLNAVSPLSGVTIGIEELARGKYSQATTDVSGYYLFDDVRPGAYSMWAEARGYGCILIPHITVRYGERVRQDFNFVRGKAYGGCEPIEKRKVK